jgi:predicted nucleotidyltransferase component of viral defense system
MFNTSGFDSRLIEKIYRINDILQKLYTTEYTKKRLTLYGGTALNFLHFKDIPRLSIDIDFNYRDQQQNDWTQERNEIDTILKKILHNLHYDNNAIAIQPSYPLTRFDVGYKTADGGKDSLKIEIGYLRRMPVLSKDILLPFTHLKTGDEFPVQTPQREELFGNKFCTFLYRYGDKNIASSRDLFDTYTISKMKLNTTLFDVTIVIDSLMRKEPRLYNRNPDTIIKNVMIDDQLKNLIRNKYVPSDIKEKSQGFITKHLNNSKDKYKTLIDTFFDHHRFEPTLLKHHNLLNQHIREHPSILWNLKQLEEKKKR